jgi:hypothetical protein
MRLYEKIVPQLESELDIAVADIPETQAGSH